MAALTLELSSGGKGGIDSPIRPTAEDDSFYDGPDPAERVRRAITAINRFGNHIVNPEVKGEKIAIMSVDPSSIAYGGIRKRAE
jgi:hypothetical protein